MKSALVLTFEGYHHTMGSMDTRVSYQKTGGLNELCMYMYVYILGFGVPYFNNFLQGTIMK